MLMYERNKYGRYDVFCGTTGDRLTHVETEAIAQRLCDGGPWPRVMMEDLHDLRVRCDRQYGPMDCDLKANGVIAQEFWELQGAINARAQQSIRAELMDIANAALRRVAEIDRETAHG